MGFSRQEYWSGLPLPSPISHLGFLFCECKSFLIFLLNYFFNVFLILDNNPYLIIYFTNIFLNLRLLFSLLWYLQLYRNKQFLTKFLFFFFNLWLLWVLPAVPKAFSSCSNEGYSLVEVHRLLKAVASLVTTGSRAYELHSVGSAQALLFCGHVRSSWTRDWTHVPCSGRWILTTGQLGKSQNFFCF